MNEQELQKRLTRQQTGTIAVKCINCGSIEEEQANFFDGASCKYCHGQLNPLGYLTPQRPSPAQVRQRHIQHEGEEQAALFRWVEYASGNTPELRLLYHIPNGGSRNAREGANLKRQGVRAGVPDLCLPVARGDWHGLYIELKYGDNKPTKEQNMWLEALKEQNYVATVCHGWQEAQEVIQKYLEMEQHK